MLAVTLIVATSGAATVSRAQPVASSIGASLTILQPLATQPVRVTGFSLGRDGVARIETTAPTSAQASQLVMTRISNSATGLAPEPQVPELLPPSSATARIRYLVNVGRAPPTPVARRLELRVEYVIVAGN